MEMELVVIIVQCRSIVCGGRFHGKIDIELHSSLLLLLILLLLLLEIDAREEEEDNISIPIDKTTSMLKMMTIQRILVQLFKMNATGGNTITIYTTITQSMENIDDDARTITLELFCHASV